MHAPRRLAFSNSLWTKEVRYKEKPAEYQYHDGACAAHTLRDKYTTLKAAVAICVYAPSYPLLRDAAHKEAACVRKLDKYIEGAIVNKLTKQMRLP